MKTRQAATWLVAPILLLSVAAVQWWRVAAYDQSSWSGAGMGMFATFEEAANRRVTVKVHLAGRLVSGVLPESHRADADALRVVPSIGATRRLARELAEEAWVMKDGQARSDAGGTVADRVIVTVEGVEVRGGADDPTLAVIEIRRAEAFPL